MICPYCEQGGILRVKVKKSNEIIKICEECDAVWLDDVLEELGTTFERYTEQRGYANSWDELEIIDRI